MAKKKPPQPPTLPPRPSHTPDDLPVSVAPTAELIAHTEWVVVEVKDGHRRGVKVYPSEKAARDAAQHNTAYEVEAVTTYSTPESDDHWFRGDS